MGQTDAGATDAGWENSQPEQVQSVIGCALAFAAVFVRFGYLHETLVAFANTKLYLLYVFAAPALLEQAACVTRAAFPDEELDERPEGR